MNRIIVVALIAAGCQDAHHVEILIGPTPTTLSRGFTCTSDAGESMLFRGVTDPPGAPVVYGGTFSVVVDFITLGDGIPGCRGEEITTWCATHDCKPAFVEPRYCRDVTLDNILPSDVLPENADALVARLLTDIYRQLSDTGNIIDDAPDVPVIIRLVITDQPCSALTVALPGQQAYPAIDTSTGPLVTTPPMSPDLMGCAYSCPVVLDQIDGSMEPTLDGGRTDVFGRVFCEPEVRVCAGNLQLASD